MGAKPAENEERPSETWAAGPDGVAGVNFEVRAFEIYLSILTGIYAQGGAEVIRFEPLAERAIEATEAFDGTLERMRRGHHRSRPM